MKKALILALILIFCLSVFSFSAIAQDLSDGSAGGDTSSSGSTSNSSTSNYTAGDVNDDGVINISDVQALLKFVNGQDVSVVEATLDMNGDGIINISDVQVLLKFVNEQNIVPDSNTMYQEDFSFAEIDNYTFVYASGVGAWGAYLTVYEDGSFEG